MANARKDLSNAPNAPMKILGAVETSRLEEWLDLCLVGEFLLTDAIRLHPDGDVLPVAGYLRSGWRDPDDGSLTPALIASVSAESIWDIFWRLAGTLPEEIGICLEGTHPDGYGRPTDRHFYRLGMERIIAESILMDFEDVILQDGCSGIALFSAEGQQGPEVQLDGHKLIHCYGADLGGFADILEGAGLKSNPRMRLIHESVHVHQTTRDLEKRFGEMVEALGCESAD